MKPWLVKVASDAEMIRQWTEYRDALIRESGHSEAMAELNKPFIAQAEAEIAKHLRA